MIKVAHLRNDFSWEEQTFIAEILFNFRNVKPILFVNKLIGNANLNIQYVINTKFQRYSLSWFNQKFKQKVLKNPYSYFERKMKELDINIIHCHFGQDGYLFLPLKNRIKIPYITSFYGIDASRIPRLPGWDRKYKELFHKGDLFLVLGNSMKKSLIDLGCPEEKVKIHYLGVDLNKFSYERKSLEKNGGITFIMCGRFVEKKGFSYGIKAFKRVCQAYKRTRLLIVGDGKLKGELETLVSEYRLQQKVEFVGKVSNTDFSKIIKMAQVCLVPSVTAKDDDKEGTPFVAIEAQASGLPVIGSRHADIPEVVIDNKTGFIVNERDIDGLAEKMLYFIEHPDMISEFGRNGRKHIEKDYNISIQTRKLEELYKTLLK